MDGIEGIDNDGIEGSHDMIPVSGGGGSDKLFIRASSSSGVRTEVYAVPVHGNNVSIMPGGGVVVVVVIILYCPFRISYRNMS